MGSIFSLRYIFGLIKDKASLSKAAILSKPNATSLHLAVLRATTHSPPVPPSDRQLSALLLLGNGSRTTASDLITALMNRLHRTGNCIVALKCLIIIHYVIKRGSFIIQDQLSIFPSSGGFNYLKLSDFHDRATAATWSLSIWVRWYALYLETILSTSRVLGYLLCSSSSSTIVNDNQEHRISSFLNADLIKDIDSLVVLIEEICKIPDSLVIEENMFFKEIMTLLINDYLSAVSKVSSRLSELKERLSSLNFGESVELTCSLKRLQDCKERLSGLYLIKKPSIEMLWGLTQELRDQIGMLKVNREAGKFLSFGSRRDKVSESARFEGEVLRTRDSAQFQSGRFGLSKYSSFSVVDQSVQLILL